MQLIYRWTKSLDPNLKKGLWAPEEDAVSPPPRRPRPRRAVLGPSFLGGLSGGCGGHGCPQTHRRFAVFSCRSCFEPSPSTGSRIGLKSGKRCQVGAMPSAEIGELDPAG